MVLVVNFLLLLCCHHPCLHHPDSRLRPHVEVSSRSMTKTTCYCHISRDICKHNWRLWRHRGLYISRVRMRESRHSKRVQTHRTQLRRCNTLDRQSHDTTLIAAKPLHISTKARHNSFMQPCAGIRLVWRFVPLNVASL